MWERTLQDLVRGLRANKKDEAKFIATAVDEVRQEIKSDDMQLKAGAVLKLTYLDMLGYDMSWASFHVVEVMSSPKVHLKSIGYLAATQSFNQDTDVLMLTTNLLKKDLSSTPADISVTLNGLSHLVTPELSRDLSPELIVMLKHSRPPIRKRAILSLYKFVMANPEVMLTVRQRFEEKLDDPDSSVVAATVNILCELARSNPQDYLLLAPQLFHLLTTSSNNWMLIKIIKLFGSLSPHEPRLVKKLQPPITELISTTSAISLLYECVHTCIIGGMLQGPSGDSLARLCVSKLAAFIQDPDQNLKYIALQAMAKIVPTHPHLIAEYQDTILSSVNDQDISIRMRALELVSAMVNRNTLQSVIQQLLAYLVTDSPATAATQSLLQSTSANPSSNLSPSLSPAYRLILSQRILAMGSHSTYEKVTNFEWYLSVLVDLVHVANVDIGAEIRDQIVDVAGRVRGVRPFAVKLMSSLLVDENLLHNVHEQGACSEVLWAAAWICGEYCHVLSDPQKLLSHLLRSEVDCLGTDIIAVYIQASLKIFGVWTADLAQNWSEAELLDLNIKVKSTIERMQVLANSEHIEVQERASNALQLFMFMHADLNAYQPKANLPVFPPTDNPLSDGPAFPKSLYLLQPLFPYELNPVASLAQVSVPVPKGLDLDAWIVTPPKEAPLVGQQGDDQARRKTKSKKAKEKGVNGSHEKSSDLIMEADNEFAQEKALREQRKAERLAQMRDDPYYIIDGPPTQIKDDSESIPIVRLEDMPPVPHESRLPSLRSAPQTHAQFFAIDKQGEMPLGATTLPPSKPTSGPVPSRSATPARLDSFSPYELANGSPKPETPPETIMVLRTKKRGAGKKKSIPLTPLT